jgi:hypothetical protein
MVAHPVILRGLTFEAGSGRPQPATGSRPVLVERTDEDFLSSLLEELRSEQGRRRLASTVRNAGEPAPGLKLFQPVHRTFELVLVEALCDTFGEPRLDPTKIESAGLVVRRLGSRPGEVEGWMHRGGKVRGWVPLHGTREQEQDPSPERRRVPPDARLHGLLMEAEPQEEGVTRLFLAPPEVCAAAGRTLLYGLVPVASSELATREALPQYGDDELRGLLAPWLSASTSVSLQGIASKTYSRRYQEEVGGDPQAGQRLEQFASMLRALVSVFNAFEDKGMLAALNSMELEYEQAPHRRPAGTALAQAVEVFVHERTDRLFTLPKAWPRLSQAQATTLERAAAAASARRLEALLPRPSRFDTPGARYEVRAFIRVHREDGCPPALVWSASSQPFEIASWYESGKLPPIQVSLPPVTRDNVRGFTPNVAFQVPRNIFNLLAKNKPKDFLEGKAEEGGSGGLDWLCGFNIPIITLCAFIVLSIFLSLLNIVFWWLAFIKICIPLPRSSRQAQGGTP